MEESDSYAKPLTTSNNNTLLSSAPEMPVEDNTSLTEQQFGTEKLVLFCLCGFITGYPFSTIAAQNDIFRTKYKDLNFEFWEVFPSYANIPLSILIIYLMNKFNLSVKVRMNLLLPIMVVLFVLLAVVCQSLDGSKTCKFPINLQNVPNFF